VVISLALIGAACAGVLAARRMTIFDFNDERAAEEWASIDDRVMGGLSSSRLEPTGEGTVVFTGSVSLANNGGFASVRSRPSKRDLHEFAGLTLQVRGDGRRYKINLKDDGQFDGLLYHAAFDTVPGQWQTVRLRFEEFVPTFRGRSVRGAGPLDLSRVSSFGLMISDKQSGPFRLELGRIEAFED